MTSCDFLHTVGGMRVRSGQASVTLTIDGVSRDLRVVRNGKGRSRLDKGFITLAELEQHVAEGASVKATVTHDGVEIPLMIDPRNSMGREGRKGARDLDTAIRALDVAQRHALGALQLQTLPDGRKNAAEASARLRFALRATRDELLDDETLLNMAGLLDADMATLLMRRHQRAASRMAFGLSKHGADPELLSTVSAAARQALHQAGWLAADGGIPLLERFDLSGDELRELARRNTVLDARHGALVGAVPVELWREARNGALVGVTQQLRGTQARTSTPLLNSNQQEVVLTGATHTMPDGSQVVFGAPAGSVWGDGVRLMPRNPYVLAGLDPTSAQGRATALEFTAAILAVTEATSQQGCWRCQSRDTRCAKCMLDPIEDLRSTTRVLLGDTAPDTTVVDALLLAAAGGDNDARRAFQRLAQLGERMIESQSERRYFSVLDEDQRDELRSDSSGWHASWQTSDRMRKVWGERPAREIQELERCGVIEPVRAAELMHEAVDPRSAWRDDIDTAVGLEINAVTAQRGEHTQHLSLTDLFWVREIEFLPESDAQGNMLMRPAGEYTNTLRSSLHGSLNGRAAGHMFRQGDSAKHVVIVPMQAMVDANPGSLDVLYAVDSFFTPPPGEGLVLPAGSAQLFHYDQVPTTPPLGDFEPGSRDEEIAVLTAQGEARDAFVWQKLQEAGATKRFAQGSTHYSSDGVDARLSEIAHELGAASTLHQNTLSSRVERMQPMAETSAPTPLSIRLADIMTMSPNARAQLANHDCWWGVDMRTTRRDDDSIV